MEIKMPIFSARIKELRKERGLKQVEMAQLLNCAENHYQKIEYGQVNIPSLTLLFLADYFDVSTDYLLGRTDIRETPGKSTAPM
ncbi:MAG: helix-turn-helix transcriptional regulator [Oscillospiraceae bacterium]|jgi:transcriptional regulator with XRE-family HTH domain|nr:helix-turn-helix transcriptional regulator [Oscillospiraceae bacterium]